MSLVAVRLKTSKLSGTRGFCWPETRDAVKRPAAVNRSEEHTSELQSQSNLVCRLLLENKTLFSARLSVLLRLCVSFKSCVFFPQFSTLSRTPPPDSPCGSPPAALRPSALPSPLAPCGP